MRRRSLALAAVLCLAGTAASAEPLHFSAQLNGAAETPPNTETGRGDVTAELDPDTRVLTYRATYAGTTGPVTMAHFHGPAAPGAAAPPVVMAPSAASPITGAATLTPAQVDDLKAGRWYFNVHTQAHPGGELRGQLGPTSGSARF